MIASAVQVAIRMMKKLLCAVTKLQPFSKGVGAFFFQVAFRRQVFDLLFFEPVVAGPRDLGKVFKRLHFSSVDFLQQGTDLLGSGLDHQEELYLKLIKY